METGCYAGNWREAIAAATLECTRWRLIGRHPRSGSPGSERCSLVCVEGFWSQSLDVPDRCSETRAVQTRPDASQYFDAFTWNLARATIIEV